MSAEARMTVAITFQSPQSPYEGGQGASALHERKLDDVPKSKAAQMAKDFSAYQSKETESRRKLYRYGDEDQERLVALDFDEIVALIASQSPAS